MKHGSLYVAGLICALCLTACGETGAPGSAPVTPVGSASAQALTEEQQIQQSLNDYFAAFYQTAFTDASKQWSHDDFASVNGYLFAKYQSDVGNTSRKLYNGIHDINLESVNIQDVQMGDSALTAQVYVNYSYENEYGGEAMHNAVTDHLTVTLTPDTYQVSDLDWTDSIEADVLKDSLELHQPTNDAKEYAAIDAYFAECAHNTDALANYRAEKAQTTDQKLQATLNHYFNELYQTMLASSTREFSHDDFASTDGYLVGKLFTNERHDNNICSVVLENVDITNTTTRNDQVTAEVYVNFSYTAGNENEREKCSGGANFTVTLVSTKNGYQVTDLNQTHADDIDVCRDALHLHSSSTKEADFDTIDQYFAARQADADEDHSAHS